MERIIKNTRRVKSKLCHRCGLRKSFKKRSSNLIWRENLSKSRIGMKFSGTHKQNLSTAAKRRNRKKVGTRNIAYNSDQDNSWTLNKRFVLDRDGKRCRHCGDSEKLEVHHINPFKKSKSNHIDNLITLCVRCHRRAEESRSPVSERERVCGIVLAGGRGTRLSPNTVFHNKHEMPLGAVPMIFYPIRTLRSLRVTDVLIVLDRHNVGRIMEMLGDGSEFGMSFTYRIQNNSGGIAEALSLGRDFVKDRIAYVILGDNVFEMGEFQKPVKFWTTGCVFVKEVDNPKDYGVAEVMGDKVLSVVEKPEKPKTNLAVTGLYAYRSEIFELLDSFTPSDRDELEISSLNDYLARQGALSFKTIKGVWMDAGYSVDGYVEAQRTTLRWWNEGKK